MTFNFGNVVYILYLVFGYSILDVEGIVCYSCTSLTEQFPCDQNVTCGVQENCYVEEKSVAPGRNYIERGCRSKQACVHNVHAQPVIIGKRDQQIQNIVKTSCCSHSFCNERFTSSMSSTAVPTPFNGFCRDSTTIDCTDKTLHHVICKDIDLRQACPFSCKICVPTTTVATTFPTTTTHLQHTSTVAGNITCGDDETLCSNPQLGQIICGDKELRKRCPILCNVCIPPYMACNKLTSITAVAVSKPVVDSHATMCPDLTHSSADAVLLKFCSAHNKNNWKLGKSVSVDCNNIPRYTAIGRFENGGLSEKVGILTGCKGTDSFEIISQTCGHPVTIESVKMPTSLSYFTIYW